MRKLVLILIAFIAVITFIRAFDNSAGINPVNLHSGVTGISPGISAGIGDIEAGQ